MNFNSVLKLFTPKDKVFFVLFEKTADILVEMASILEKEMKEPDIEKRKDYFHQIADLEHANDDVTHKVFVELGRNFITPFDREDIHVLASNLDDVADLIHGASKKMNLYNFYEVHEGITSLSEIIYNSTLEVRKAILELKTMANLRNITDACIKINSLENEGDEIYDGMIVEIFNNEDNAIRIIKLKEILKSLENAIDKCEDVANVVESIIIKYS